MASKNLVICDPEEGYAQALAAYIMGKDLSLQVQVCSSLAHVYALEKDMELNYLLLSDAFPAEEREGIHAGQIFTLSTQSGVEETIDTVYKYQSGEKILEVLIKGSDGLSGEGELIHKSLGKKHTEIIGIFSPVHRVGKTTYALALGAELAANANVLYLNLELYGGSGGHFPEGAETMTDVLYYAGQEKKNLGLMLTTLVKHRDGLDYVLPAPVSEDVRKVPASAWIDLFQQILSQSIYEILILDIDEGLQEVYQLLRACTKLYVPTEKDAYAQAKVKQFTQELTRMGYEDVAGKIIWREGKACKGQSSSKPEF